MQAISALKSDQLSEGKKIHFFCSETLEISKKSCQISKSFLSFPFFQPSKNIVHDIQSETQRNVVDVQHRFLHISCILKTRFRKESYKSGVRRSKNARLRSLRTISLSLKGLFCFVSVVALLFWSKCMTAFKRYRVSKHFFSTFKLLTSQRHGCYRSNDSFQYFLPPNQFFVVFDVAFLPWISFIWDFRRSCRGIRCLTRAGV